MKKVLVVFEDHPEETHFIQLQVTEEEADQLLRCHLQFVNSTNISQEVSDFIMGFFYNSDGKLKFNPTCEVIKDRHFDYIILTGFLN